MNTKVTHSKEQTESQTESSENGNPHCHDNLFRMDQKANSKHLQTTYLILLTLSIPNI